MLANILFLVYSYFNTREDPSVSQQIENDYNFLNFIHEC